METKSKKITKVALVCGFSNFDIQKKLRTWKEVDEFAPWIVATIKEVNKLNEIELHVISLHDYLWNTTQFSVGNVNYHFLSFGIPVIHRHWPDFFRFDVFTNFRTNRKKIKKLVDNINPDIVHLYGAENAIYSSSILDLLNYPHLVTVQGFLFKQAKKKNGVIVNKRLQIENKIYSKAKNFGVGYSYMKDELLSINRNANIETHHFPVNVEYSNNSKKKYDLIYFARIVKMKGIEDFIKIVASLKNKFPSINAVVIGMAENSYLDKLKDIVSKNNCSENINFLGFIQTQKKMHKIVSESKICVLPTYNDTVPGTIIESMFLKTAVVSYKTGGIPTLNEKVKTVELAEQGDYLTLAKKIEELLEDDLLRFNLAEKAFEYISEKYSNADEVNKVIQIYRKIINNEQSENKAND